jgi:hypothetical protein
MDPLSLSTQQNWLKKQQMLSKEKQAGILKVDPMVSLDYFLNFSGPLYFGPRFCTEKC